MIRFCLFVVSFFLFLFHTHPPLFAHVLKTDGSIGAVLHISPEDDPIAGEVSSFFFDIKDTQGTFLSANCLCEVTIAKDGENLLTQPVFAEGDSPDLTNASMMYTFPEKGVYQVSLNGTPSDGSAFQPFSLRFDVRVARDTQESSSSQQTPQILFLILPISLIVIVFAGLLLRKKQRGVK